MYFITIRSNDEGETGEKGESTGEKGEAIEKGATGEKTSKKRKAASNAKLPKDQVGRPLQQEEDVSDSQSQTGETGGDNKTKPKIYISPEEEEKMIAWFEAHPMLWDTCCREYKMTSSKTREAMYDDYAKSCSIPGATGM